MKKYILAICCMAFTGQVFAQPQTFFVHKKDGSVLELPVGPTKIGFTGKAVVNDGDYIQIENIEPVVAKGVQPYALVKTNPEQYLDTYGIDYERMGVCYATEPKVTGLNGNVIEISKEEYSDNYNYRRLGVKVDSLDFNSTYYCRSFIYWRGKYYYSQEYSFTTGKPSSE